MDTVCSYDGWNSGTLLKYLVRFMAMFLYSSHVNYLQDMAVRVICLLDQRRGRNENGAAKNRELHTFSI
jgi:hypothetical protein